MNIKNTITQHYKKFFDLYAKGIALDEDDHLNIDWAEDLVKNCFIPNVSNSRLTELEQENKKLRFMVENGLGEKDLENDCC